MAAAPGSSSGLQEIIVTAQRAETNLQQTPISVAAVSGELLAQQGASTLMDLQTFIPNLQVGTTTLQGAGNGRFAIRGIGQEAGTGAAVGLYIDEVFYPTGAGNMMGLFDVDRIEVLRGPQGTLFGRNTIGGAIQYITVKPGKEFGGYVEGTGGNYGRADFNGALNIPLGDTLAARVAVGYNSRDGFVRDNLQGIDRGEDERKAGRVALRWTPSSSLTVDVKGEWLSTENNGRAATIHGYDGSLFPNGQNDGAQFVILGRILSPTPNNVHLCPAIGAPPSPGGACLNAESPGDFTAVGSDAQDFSELDYTAGSLVINWELSDAVAIKSITGYSLTEGNTGLDYDSTPLSLFSGLGPKNDTTALSEELQLRLNLVNNRLHWTTGLFYFDQDLEALTAFAFGTAKPDPALATGNKNGLESKAIFSQATFDFTDRLSGIVGVRYSEEDVSSRTLSAQGALGPEFSSNFDDTSPQVGLQFQATDDQMYYVNAAKGFRAGGFGTNPGFVNGVKSFDPEEAWTYEVGARLEFLDRRLRVNPTVFFTDWTGLQLNTLITVPEPGASCPPGPSQNCPGVGTVPQNVGDAEIKGLELEILFQATERLTLQGSFGYLDSKYTNVTSPTAQVYPASTGGFFGGSVIVPNLCDGNGDPTLVQLNPTRPPAQLAPLAAQYECQGGSDLMYAPEIKFSVGAKYAFPLSGGAEIVTSADYGWTDEQRSQVINLGQTPLPSYGLLNARVQYNAPDNRWSLAVFGTNLTDEYYYYGSTDFASGYTPGTTVFDPARPVEYGATLHFNF